MVYTMKKLLLLGGALIALSGHAWAIADQDNSAISQKIMQEQTVRNTNTNRNVNTNTNRNVNNNSAGSVAHSSSTGGSAQSSAVGGNVTVNTSQYVDPAAPAGNVTGSGYGGGNRYVAPPSPSLALAPASGGVCPTRGLGAAASGTTGTGLFTFTWEAENCTKIDYYRTLTSTGHPLAAEYILINGYSEDSLRRAFQWEADMNARQPMETIAAKAETTPFIDSFCTSWPTACE